jgi:hypothetical protein
MKQDRFFENINKIKKKPLTKLTNKKKRPKLIKLEMKKEITDTSEIMRLIGEYF